MDCMSRPMPLIFGSPEPLREQVILQNPDHDSSTGRLRLGLVPFAATTKDFLTDAEAPFDFTVLLLVCDIFAGAQKITDGADIVSVRRQPRQELHRSQEACLDFGRHLNERSDRRQERHLSQNAAAAFMEAREKKLAK